jgi:hypothetical protein
MLLLHVARVGVLVTEEGTVRIPERQTDWMLYGSTNTV